MIDTSLLKEYDILARANRVNYYDGSDSEVVLMKQYMKLIVKKELPVDPSNGTQSTKYRLFFYRQKSTLCCECYASLNGGIFFIACSNRNTTKSNHWNFARELSDT